MSKFKIGDNVVHLTHGVGKIVGLEEREFNDKKITKYFIIEIKDGGAPKKIFVLYGQAEQRLRHVINKDQVAKVYSILSDYKTTIVERQTWNMRYREYMERIHSGQIDSIAEVVASLFRLKSNKCLSFGERKLIEQGKTLLVGELALVECVSERDIEQKIEKLLERE